MAFVNCIENLHVWGLLLQYWWRRMVPYIRIKDLIENFIYVDARGRLPLARYCSTAYHDWLICPRLSAAPRSLPLMSPCIFYPASDNPSHPHHTVFFLFSSGDIFSNVAYRADLLAAGGGLHICVARPCRHRRLPRVWGHEINHSKCIGTQQIIREFAC